MTRLVLPAVPADATPQQSAALCGQGCIDLLDQWERWLRMRGAPDLASEVALVRTRLYLRARAVIEGDGAGVAVEMREAETKAMEFSK